MNALEQGLDQLSRGGLRRLRKHIEAGKPLCVNGFYSAGSVG